MGNKGESSVKSVNKLMSFAQHRMAITKRMLALASLFLTLAVVPVHQAHAMSGFLSDAVSNSVDTNLTDTCGLCHFAFGGRETRGNYGMDYWLYDNDTMDVGQNAGLGAIDSSHDGRTNATIWAQTGNTSADGGATMANFPDKDQDGYIALWYRADTTGIYGEIADAAATGTGGSSGNTATGIVGWDIDDNDFAAGNIAWGTDVGASTPADVTAPGTVADFV